MPKGIATVSVLLLAVMLLGCGPSKKQQAIHKQEAGVAEMKRVRAAFGDLQIALNAGVSVQEFSQRTNDTLVKIGMFQGTARYSRKTVSHQQGQGRNISSISTMRLTFPSLSKPLLGPNLDEDDAILEDMMRDSEWKLIQDRFPARVESGYFTFSSPQEECARSLGTCEENTKAAGDLMDQLSAPTT